MEIPLRAALIAWLAADPALSDPLNAITEEAPSRTSLPWLAIAASASSDWSSKTHQGREVRVALELHCRGDQPSAADNIFAAIEQRIEAMPAAQSHFTVITRQFLRSRVEQRGESRRVLLIEYRFRIQAD